MKEFEKELKLDKGSVFYLLNTDRNTAIGLYNKAHREDFYTSVTSDDLNSIIKALQELRWEMNNKKYPFKEWKGHPNQSSYCEYRSFNEPDDVDEELIWLKSRKEAIKQVSFILDYVSGNQAQQRIREELQVINLRLQDLNVKVEE